MATPGIHAVRDRVAELLLGKAVGAQKAIKPGRFVEAPDRVALERIAEGMASGAPRPFFLDVVDDSDELPELGRANVSGNLIDSAHTLELALPYLAGGGSLGKADPKSLSREMSLDWQVIRNVLGVPLNVDEVETGCMSLNLERGTRARPRPRGKSRIAMMVIRMTALVRVDWTKEPS